MSQLPSARELLGIPGGDGGRRISNPTSAEIEAANLLGAPITQPTSQKDTIDSVLERVGTPFTPFGKSAKELGDKLLPTW